MANPPTLSAARTELVRTARGVGDEAFADLQARLQSYEPDHRHGFIHDLKAKVGDRAMQIVLLDHRIEMLEDGLRPPNAVAVAVSELMSLSSKMHYGILQVCGAGKLLRVTVQQCKAAAGTPATMPGKFGPRTTLDDRALIAGICNVLDASPLVGKGFRKVWARLQQQHEIRTSVRRVLRIMRALGLLASQWPTAIREPPVHEGTIVTQR